MGPRALPLVLFAFVAACQGPRPSVADVRVAPSPLAGRYRVEATITNRSRGEGQVDVQIHLRDRDSGKTVDDDRDLELRGHEAAHFTADVAAPAGHWSASVDAQYPPR